MSSVWMVPMDPEFREYATREEALARAWELTPAGGVRAEPLEKREMTVAQSVTDEDVRYMTWKHVMAPGEVYSQKIKRIGMEEMSRAAAAFNYELMASTYRYNTDGNVVTFYCDARRKPEPEPGTARHLSISPEFVVGQVITMMVDGAPTYVIFDGSEWLELDSAPGRALADSLSSERRTLLDD